jgi:hypothetical protein
VIAHSGGTVSVQSASTTYGTDFVPWLDVSGTGLELHRTEIAATGTLLAFEGELWQGGTKTVGKIGLLSINGVDNPVTFPAAVDCFVPAVGVATDVSLSQDARFVAWTDDQGLKVAGTPTTAADPCTLTSAPVVIAAGGKSASIGGADVAAFLPPVPPPPVPPTSGPGPAPTTTSPTAPSLTLPAKVTAKSLRTGLSLKLTVAAAGKVAASAFVGTKQVATGSATATRAGQITIKLKFSKAGRKLARKGKTLKIRVTQGGRTVTKTVKLR